MHSRLFYKISVIIIYAKSGNGIIKVLKQLNLAGTLVTFNSLTLEFVLP